MFFLVLFALKIVNEEHTFFNCLLGVLYLFPHEIGQLLMLYNEEQTFFNSIRLHTKPIVHITAPYCISDVGAGDFLMVNEERVEVFLFSSPPHTSSTTTFSPSTTCYSQMLHFGGVGYDKSCLSTLSNSFKWRSQNSPMKRDYKK